MVRASFSLELSRSPDTPRTLDTLVQDPVSLEGTTIITMVVILSMEAMDTTTMAIRTAMGMEEMATSSISALLHQQGRI